MNRYVHWMGVRLDKQECYATHYWTGEQWETHARSVKLFSSLKEARQDIPLPTPARTYIWASGSRAKKTLFSP